MKTTIRNMKSSKQLLFVLIGLGMASCTTNPESIEAKQEQLSAYKQEVLVLEEKIVALEQELDASAEIEYINVRALEIQPQLFEHYIEVTGNVEADQEVDVSPEGSGKIISIGVEEGDQVKKGTILARLNTDILDRTIEEVKVNLDLATTTFERQQNLWDQKIGSEMQYLQAKTAKESIERQLESLQAQKEMSVIKSPVDGVVDVVYQKTGEIASPNVPFAKVINISHVKVYSDVAETYLTKVGKGDTVTVEFPALAREMEAPILQVGNYIDPNNRTFRIRIDFSNSDNLIKPNMIALVKIRDYMAENALVIPSLLIKEDFQGSYTFIVDGDTAKKVYVEPGVSDNNMTEVISGLEPGEKIISEGFDQVINGSPIML